MIQVAEAPYRLNVVLTMLALAAGLCLLVIVPTLLLPQAPVLAGIVVVIMALAAPLSRALLHEAIHGRLVNSRLWNDQLGRAIAIVLGIAFDAIRFGHLAHHRFPRHELDRADVITPGSSRVAACARYYLGLLGGIYLREILAASIMLLPRPAIEGLTERVLKDDEHLAVLRGAIRRSLDRHLWRTRCDLLIVGLVYTGSFYLYGHAWPILLGGLAARALIISLQDNVAHYGTEAVIGAAAHNSSASRWASALILNQNLHGVHHDHPDIPWNLLPTAIPDTGNSFAGSYLSLLLRQFQGPRQSFAARVAPGQVERRAA